MSDRLARSLLPIPLELGGDAKVNLVYDDRGQIGDQPAVHALICGVSWYKHLPGPDPFEPAPDSYEMSQLPCGAASASRVYDWLIDSNRSGTLSLPLATCRLLLSPSTQESPSQKSALPIRDRCTLQDFMRAAKEWRKDASSNPDSIAFFYFAGHGVQRTKGDSVLLMEDFGDGLGGTLFKAVSTRDVYFGMAKSSSRPRIAQKQFYFIDACRVLPDGFKDFEKLETSSVWEVELSGEDRRVALTFYATASGAAAWGLGDQTIFSAALIRGLQGGGAQPPSQDSVPDAWNVSYRSLLLRFGDCISEVCEDLGIIPVQTCRMDGAGLQDIVIVKVPKRPGVKLKLQLQPTEAVGLVTVSLRDYAGGTPCRITPHSASEVLSQPVLAGYWEVGAEINPPTPGFVNYPLQPSLITPPRFCQILKVAQ